MIQGKVEEAWNETHLGDAVYSGYTTLTVPPRWDPEVKDRVRGLIPDYQTPDRFKSGYIPDGTPVYKIRSRNGKWIANSLIPSASVKSILEKAGDPYMTALGETWDSAYSQFLREYSSSEEPFLREMRIHLYRRDRHAIFGNYEIALGENRILEKYFGRTLHKTRFAWQNGTEKRILALLPHDAQSAYISPVANHVTYWIRGSQVWIYSIGLILLLILFEKNLLKYMQVPSNGC